MKKVFTMLLLILIPDRKTATILKLSCLKFLLTRI